MPVFRDTKTYTEILNTKFIILHRLKYRTSLIGTDGRVSAVLLWGVPGENQSVGPCDLPVHNGNRTQAAVLRGHGAILCTCWTDSRYKYRSPKLSQVVILCHTTINSQMFPQFTVDSPLIYKHILLFPLKGISKTYQITLN